MMMQEKPTLVVMAAGMGSRYGGLKQLEAVGPHGELIIHYSIYDALRAGFQQVIFIIREAFEAEFRARIGSSVEKRCETFYIHQTIADTPPGLTAPLDRRKPWGTAHAVYAAREVIATPFAVINADDFYGQSAYQVMATHLQTAADLADISAYSMVGYPLANTLTDHGHVSRGVCEVSPENYLVGIEERLQIQRFGDKAMYTEDGEHWIELPMQSTVSMNFWGFPPRFLDELAVQFPRFMQVHTTDLDRAEFLLPTVVGGLIREQGVQVKVLRTNAQWHGVTYREDAPLVRQAIRDLIAQGVYPADLTDLTSISA